MVLKSADPDTGRGKKASRRESERLCVAEHGLGGLGVAAVGFVQDETCGMRDARGSYLRMPPTRSASRFRAPALRPPHEGEVGIKVIFDDVDDRAFGRGARARE